MRMKVYFLGGWWRSVPIKATFCRACSANLSPRHQFGRRCGFRYEDMQIESFRVGCKGNAKSYAKHPEHKFIKRGSGRNLLATGEGSSDQ